MVSGIGGPPGGKIGGPGAPGAPAPTDGAKPVAGKSFGEVARTEAPKNATPLERLRAGEIDSKQYTELRVQEATAHLDGVLPSSDIERIRADLHELIENDPDVAALVKAAQTS